VSQALAARRVDVAVELVDAFDEQALAIAASCAAPNTRLRNLVCRRGTISPVPGDAA